MKASAPGATALGAGLSALSGGQLPIVGSTVSGNTSAHVGGGISAIAASGVTVTSTTVANNSAPAGSGIFGAATLQDTIVANTPATNCSIPVASQGHNLETGTGCGLSGSGDVQRCGSEARTAAEQRRPDVPRIDLHPTVPAGVRSRMRTAARMSSVSGTVAR